MVTHVIEISTPPTPADPPAEFEQKAALVWSELHQAVPQMNQQADEIEQIGADAEAAKARAIQESDAAAGYRNEAQGARDTSVIAATTAINEAAQAVAAQGLAEVAKDQAQAAAESAVNRVAKTSDTGAALLPEGNNAQRPATGSIPGGALVVRGNTQTVGDYIAEYWDRGATAWRTFASQSWVAAITNALGLRLSTLESRPITVAAANFSCNASISIRSSFGISSITRESAGVMTVNFSTPQPDTNYLVFCGGSSANGRFTRVQETSAGNPAPALKTTTQVRLTHAAAFTEPLDCSEINVQIVRIQP
nr:hypothetical protein [uncultured Comamonas sp.]